MYVERYPTRLLWEAQSLFRLLEVLLRVRADLNDGASGHKLANCLPVLAVQLYPFEEAVVLFLSPPTFASLRSGAADESIAKGEVTGGNAGRVVSSVSHCLHSIYKRTRNTSGHYSNIQRKKANLKSSPVFLRIFQVEHA